MKTKNLSTFKIHKLTQAQYERARDAGNIDENALYLTPDEMAIPDASTAPEGAFLRAVNGAWTAANDLPELNALVERATKQLSNVDLNTVKENGWYSYATNTGVTNSPKDHASTLFVESYHTNDRCKQTVTLMDGHNTTIVRAYYDGSWGEWEYVNPPMTTGVEFRTTERYNGKAVYTKLVYCGYLPNNGRKMTDSGIPKDSAQIVRITQSRILASNGCVGDCDTATVVHIDATDDSDNFQIIMDTCADVTTNYEIVVIKYVYL